jgi:hypothetical protein
MKPVREAKARYRAVVPLKEKKKIIIVINGRYRNATYGQIQGNYE